MEITITTTDASEPDCRRSDFWATDSEGNRILAAPSALDTPWTEREIRKAVIRRWGRLVTIRWV